MDEQEKEVVLEVEQNEPSSEDEELYYAVLYTPDDINGLMFAYRTIGVVKGYFDPEKRTFVSSASHREYEMLDTGILHLEDCEKIDVSGMPKNVGELYKSGLFFAFPIKVSEFDAKFAEDGAEIDPTKITELGYGDKDPAVYETCAAYYNLFSVYSAEDQMNIFYMMDGDSKTLLMIQDLGKDIDSALDEAEEKMAAPNLPMVSVDIPVLNAFFEGVREFFYGPEGDPAEDAKEEVKEEVKVEPIPEIFKKLNPYDFDPDELEALISSEVIGQDAAISEVVSTLYNNYKYCMDVPGSRANILIVGPAGCGKTEIVESVARHLDIPVASFDMSSVSKTGLVGNSVTQAVRNLIFAAGGDIKKAEHGIIFMDEIDKIRQQSTNDANQGVQDELLAMLSGKKITIPSESAYDRSFIFDTSNVTFICAGAFSELFAERKRENKQIGFNPPPPQNVFRPVKTEDLNNSGIKPEVIRRLEVLITIRQLDEQNLYDIVTTSKISHLLIKEDAFLRHDNVKVYRESDYAHKVAEVASKEEIGASGLKRVVDKSLSVASRMIRLLNGEGGTLVLRKETVTDPKDFDLYKLDGEKVYTKGKRLV